jgi:hypothetical protein
VGRARVTHHWSTVHHIHKQGMEGKSAWIRFMCYAKSHGLRQHKHVHMRSGTRA